MVIATLRLHNTQAQQAATNIGMNLAHIKLFAKLQNIKQQNQMNIDTAKKRGYVDTHAYTNGSRMEELEAKLHAIRAAGYKALIVTVPTSPYSRGSKAPGYSIVAEARYMLDKHAAQARNVLAAEENEIANAKARAQQALDKELAEINNRTQSSRQWLVDNGYLTADGQPATPSRKS